MKSEVSDFVLRANFGWHLEQLILHREQCCACTRAHINLVIDVLNMTIYCLR